MSHTPSNVAMDNVSLPLRTTPASSATWNTRSADPIFRTSYAARTGGMHEYFLLNISTRPSTSPG